MNLLPVNCTTSINKSNYLINFKTRLAHEEVEVSVTDKQKNAQAVKLQTLQYVYCLKMQKLNVIGEIFTNTQTYVQSTLFIWWLPERWRCCKV